MHKAQTISVTHTRAETIYTALLLLYPTSYRKRFGTDMLVVFRDMYMDEIVRSGKMSAWFWMSLLRDIARSVVHEHGAMMRKQGIKKYVRETLHLSIFSVIGLILMLPFSLLFLFDMTIVLFTGNRNALQWLYHSPLYTLPILPIWILGFPIIAVLLNLIPLFLTIQKKSVKVFSWDFVKTNPVAFLIFIIGMGAVVLVFGHDVIPCTVNHIFSDGLLKFGHTLAVCRNA